MSYWENINIIGAIILLISIPLIPCILLWWAIGPTTVWQMIALLIIEIFVYLIGGFLMLLAIAAFSK